MKVIVYYVGCTGKVFEQELDVVEETKNSIRVFEPTYFKRVVTFSKNTKNMLGSVGYRNPNLKYKI